jgi:divalent metal cation (Fe/Co/Zn/Cd) transporter
MCLTCGCGDAHRVMGRNMTYEDLRDIAVENERTVDETLSILATTATADRQDHQQEYDKPWDTGKP